MIYYLQLLLNSFTSVHNLHNDVKDYLCQHPYNLDNVHFAHFITENIDIHRRTTISKSNRENLENVWEEYLEGVSTNRWADHIVVEATASMLNVNIEIFNSTTSNWININPVNDMQTLHTIYLGLIEELHYVILRPLNLFEGDNEIAIGSSNLNNKPDQRPYNDDDIIAHGDQSIEQISGGVQCSWRILNLNFKYMK